MYQNSLCKSCTLSQRKRRLPAAVVWPMWPIAGCCVPLGMTQAPVQAAGCAHSHHRHCAVCVSGKPCLLLSAAVLTILMRLSYSARIWLSDSVSKAALASMKRCCASGCRARGRRRVRALPAADTGPHVAMGKHAHRCCCCADLAAHQGTALQQCWCNMSGCMWLCLRMAHMLLWAQFKRMYTAEPDGSRDDVHAMPWPTRS